MRRKAARCLFIARDGAGVFGAEDDAGDFFAQKVGDELLQALITVKVDLVVEIGIVVEDFRHYVHFRPAAHDNFVGTHMTVYV